MTESPRVAPPAPTRHEDLPQVDAPAEVASQTAPTAPQEAQPAPGSQAAAESQPERTVAELKEHLATVDSTAEVDSLLAAENAREGGARKSAVEALEARRAELSGGGA
jgi:hypothetical protein